MLIVDMILFFYKEEEGIEVCAGYGGSEVCFRAKGGRVQSGPGEGV